MRRSKPQTYIHDLRDERVPEETTNRHAERDKRRLIMYLSVGGVMTFIVALWVMVLPIQLDRASESGVKSVFAPSEGIKESGASLLEEWKASVEGTKQSIMNLSEGLDEAPADDSGGSATLNVEQLKERLEAVPGENITGLPATDLVEPLPDISAGDGLNLNE